jgi:putative tryptophan/tyrosine transport system substrate-binding protein
MRRREFLGVLGSAAAWPLAAHAQQAAMPVFGFLSSSSYAASALSIAGFRQGLEEAGTQVDRTGVIEYRWADGQFDRLAALARELVSRPTTAILAAGLPAAVAAKAATARIPIVFVMGADPVQQGIVDSLNRPGGNITGVTQFFGELGGKRLELLRELVPTVTMIAILSNPKNPNAENHLRNVQAAARAIGQKLYVVTASTEAEIDTAFAHAVRERADALLVADDPFYNVRRDQLIALAAQHALPTSYYAREFCATGGLLSYGSSSRDNYRQAGVYIGRIIKGEKPADLPVLQPTKFELVVNLTTAKALGLTIPESFLLRADEVIE